jgi:hypothetical protein
MSHHVCLSQQPIIMIVPESDRRCGCRGRQRVPAASAGGVVEQASTAMTKHWRPVRSEHLTIRLAPWTGPIKCGTSEGRPQPRQGGPRWRLYGDPPLAGSCRGLSASAPTDPDLSDIMPPLSQDLDPTEPHHTERWDQESSTNDFGGIPWRFYSPAPCRGCAESPCPLSFPPVSPNYPLAARRNLT